MENIVKKAIWIGPIVLVFAIFDGNIPYYYVFGGSIRSGYWGLCGAICGLILKNIFVNIKIIKPNSIENAKNMNEQIKIISSFLNSVSIGIIITTVIVRINELEKLINWSSLIFFALACYVHYLAVVVAGCRKSETMEDSKCH